MNTRYLAPPVVCRLHRPRLLSVFLVLMLLLIGLLLLAWVLQPQAGLWRMATARLVFFAVAAALLRVERSWPRGRLAWSGADWRLYLSHQPAQGELADEGRPVSMAVVWDGNSWLWLRLQAVEGAGRMPRGLWLAVLERAFAPEVWLLLCERDSPEQWGDMRRAVYFPATQQALKP